MTKRILAAVLALLFALLLFLGTSPSRAIRAAALLNGCSWDEVICSLLAAALAAYIGLTLVLVDAVQNQPPADLIP